MPNFGFPILKLKSQKGLSRISGHQKCYRESETGLFFSLAFSKQLSFTF